MTDPTSARHPAWRRRPNWRVTSVALLLALVAALLAPVTQGAPQPGRLAPTVILVSFDGWRADYRTRAGLPNLERLMARGVRAEYLTPSFPSKTFPNHYTIVTGLYPGHHGIVANNIFDAATGRTFALSKRQEVQDPMWWGGEPIWVTAQRAGQRTATMFWPGSEAPIGGMQPTYWRPYDEQVSGRARVATVLDWLDLPAPERPTFLALYFEETDNAGHQDPAGAAVPEALLKADAWIGELVTGLERRNLTGVVNLVLVSDHGMASTSLERVVVLDDYISLDDVRVVDLNPTLGLIPKAGKEEAVYRALRKAHPRLKVYRRGDTPKHWHYRTHPRIPPIVGVADDGWQIMTRQTLQTMRASGQGQVSGQHGHDPRVTSMRALFVAAGPAFREGVVVKPFENVSIYNVLARILGVTPAPNDGDPRVVSRVLETAAGR
jgi:predicted AlkP superfamily pyrophosphatase or phosphodiesterase